MMIFLRGIIGIIGLFIGVITDGLILLTLPTIVFGILTVFFQILGPLYAWLPGCRRPVTSAGRTSSVTFSSSTTVSVYNDTNCLSEFFYQCYRTYTSIIISLFLTYTAFLLEYIYNIDFVCYGLDTNDDEGYRRTQGTIEVERKRGRSTTVVNDKHTSDAPSLSSIPSSSELRQRLRKVFISNHRTRLDWAMLWPVFLRTNYITSSTFIPTTVAPTERRTMTNTSTQIITNGGGFRALMELAIILKEDLKYLPFIGWGTQCSRYIFLQRNWSKDADHITNMLNLLRRPSSLVSFFSSSSSSSSLSSPNYSILLFPEGTDLAPSNIVKSEKFCKEKNIHFYQQILHPRTKGFLHVVQTLTDAVNGNHNQNIMDDIVNVTDKTYADLSSFPPSSSTTPSFDSLDVLYDITMAYEGYVPQTEKSLVTGKVPRKVHVYVRPYDIIRKDVYERNRSTLSSVPFIPKHTSSILSDGTPIHSIEAMEHWLLARFAEKEHSLEMFYKRLRNDASIPVQYEPSVYHTSSNPSILSPPGPKDKDMITCSGYPIQPRTPYWSTHLWSGTASLSSSAIGVPILLYLVVTLFHIIIFTVFTYLTIFYPWIILGYTVGCSLLWGIVINKYGKGMDKLEIAWLMRTLSGHGTGESTLPMDKVQ